MKDIKILKELRNGPMKSMKDDEYASIEAQVNEKGIAGLKGYAKSMIEKAMREMAYSMKKALVEKHGGHDQKTHGAWAGNGAGGKNIQDMSLDDQDEFTSRMTSAKTYEEQRSIIAEFSSRMKKASGLAVGDMVSWQASGGTARGKIEHIMRDGVLGIPKSSFSIKAEKDDPAVLIRIYRDGEETETLVGHKASTLKKA